MSSVVLDYPIASPRPVKSVPLGVAEACRLHERALALRAERQTVEAEALALRALDLLTRELGPDDPDVANVLLCLGGLREDAGDLAAAESFYRYALRLLERAEEAGEVRLRVQAMSLLAGVRQVQGRYVAAERLYRRALGIAEAALGPEHPHTALCREGLAALSES